MLGQRQRAMAHVEGAQAGAEPRRVALGLVLAAAFLLAADAAWAQDSDSEAAPYAFESTAINGGLPKPGEVVRRDTPRAALETFFAAIERDDAAGAAHILNLDAIPADEQAQRAPELALMLAYILRHRDLIDWSEVPDEPDARVLPEAQSSVAPYSRRSIELGEVLLHRRPVSVNLQRFQAEGREPVWLFSPTLVERIPALYSELSEGWLGDWIPIEERLDMLGRPSLWEWSVVGGVLLASVAAWLAVFAVVRLLARRLSRRRRWLTHTAVPAATVLAVLVFRIGTVKIFVLTGAVAKTVDIGSEVILLVSGAWLFLRLLSELTLSLSEKFIVPLTSEDPENRRTKTNVYVVRRLGLVVVAILLVGYVLSSLGAFETFGLSLLASAGVLGVLLAIAAQPLLGNMVAGMQIALTDPVRIGDVVLYQEHWGTVEDIAFAHIVIRTATDTRLIVPHSEFLSRAFENWSKGGEPVRRIVKIVVDHRVDVDFIREQVRGIVQNDQRLVEPPLVELTEADENGTTVWIWIMGTNAFTSWYLHNEVREKIIASLRSHENGRFLPRRRHLLLNEAEERTPAEARKSSLVGGILPHRSPDT